MDLVCQRIAEAVNEARSRAVPARLRVNTGEAKGKIAYNYYAPNLYDRRMSVIQAVSSRRENHRDVGQLRDPSRSAGQSA